jgi:hypothetical protein
MAPQAGKPGSAADMSKTAVMTGEDPYAPEIEAAQEWRADQNATLQATLSAWARQAGWAVAWQSDRDYKLMASASFYGDFETAAGNLLRTFAIADPPVRAMIYRGNRVIVVSTGLDRGN